MPRRAVRCVVDLDLHAVSAPGCWLPSKEDCYLSIALFSQYKNTQILNSIFPILVNESFRFEKTYFTALESEEVVELLEDELVVIELLQMSEYSDGAVHLATYTNNVRDFIYPFDTFRPKVLCRDRDIFLERTVAFPGISPKLEFSSKTVIKESYSDEMDALEDAIDYHQSTSKNIRRSKLGKRRPRSCSPRRRGKYKTNSKITSSAYSGKLHRSNEMEHQEDRDEYDRCVRQRDDFEVDYNSYHSFTQPRNSTKRLRLDGPPDADVQNYRTFTKARPSGYILPHLTDADVDYSQDSDEDNESFVSDYSDDLDVIPSGDGTKRKPSNLKKRIKPRTSSKLTGRKHPSSVSRTSRPRTRTSPVATKAKRQTSSDGRLVTPRKTGGAKPTLKRRARSTPRSFGNEDDGELETPRRSSQTTHGSARYPRPPSRERPSSLRHPGRETPSRHQSPRRTASITPRHRSLERPVTSSYPQREIPVDSARYPGREQPMYTSNMPRARQHPVYTHHRPERSGSPVVSSPRHISRQRRLSSPGDPSGVFQTVPPPRPNFARHSSARQPVPYATSPITSRQEAYPQQPSGLPYSTAHPHQPRGSYKSGYPHQPDGLPYNAAYPQQPGGLPYNAAYPDQSRGSPYKTGYPQQPDGLPYSTAHPHQPRGSYKSGYPQQPDGLPYSTAHPQQPGGLPYNSAYPDQPRGSPYKSGYPQQPGGLPYNAGYPQQPGAMPYKSGYPQQRDGLPYNAAYPQQQGRLPYDAAYPQHPGGLPYNTSVPGKIGELPQTTIPGYPGGLPYSTDPIRQNGLPSDPQKQGSPYNIIGRKPQGLPYTSRSPKRTSPSPTHPRGVTQVINPRQPVEQMRTQSPQQPSIVDRGRPRVKINISTTPVTSRSPPNVANHKLGSYIVSEYAKNPNDPYFISRTPSPTLHQRIEDLTLHHESDVRPPFVVRKLDNELIGRLPGGLLEKNAKSKPHKCIRLNKFKSGTVDFDGYSSLEYLPNLLKHKPQRPKTSFSGRSPSGVLYGFDPDDEVADLTSRVRDIPKRRSPSARRYRSPSPHITSHSPRSRKDLYAGVPNLRITRDLSPDDEYYGRDAVERSHRYRYPTHDSMDDLALDTSLARYRRYSSIYS